ncbi:MAG TPA: class I SAM-dependent methyltransferase [Mucilaginibacter sp.]|nr:class I SAM-dependent methyltransferase [Mucilaginibacter sp.]
MGKQTDAFYNKFSFFYPLVDVFLKPQKKVLFSEINNLPEGSLLEIGVGNGAHFHFYKKHKVTGVDTSTAMLEIACRKSPGNVKLFKMDGEALVFDDNDFDYVVLSHVIAVVDNPERLLEEVLRVLKPQGQALILNHFTPDNWFRYIDRALGTISTILHFRSVFYIHEIAAIQKFTLLKEIQFGLTSYFKLLIYQKK